MNKACKREDIPQNKSGSLKETKNKKDFVGQGS